LSLKRGYCGCSKSVLVSIENLSDIGLEFFARQLGIFQKISRISGIIPKFQDKSRNFRKISEISKKTNF
jgi:hypothetical protein